MKISKERALPLVCVATAAAVGAISLLAIRRLRVYESWQHPLAMATSLATGATLATLLCPEPQGQQPIRGSVKISSNSMVTRMPPYDGATAKLYQNLDGSGVPSRFTERSSSGWRWSSEGKIKTS